MLFAGSDRMSQIVIATGEFQVRLPSRCVCRLHCGFPLLRRTASEVSCISVHIRPDTQRSDAPRASRCRYDYPQSISLQVNENQDRLSQRRPTATNSRNKDEIESEAQKDDARLPAQPLIAAKIEAAAHSQPKPSTIRRVRRHQRRAAPVSDARNDGWGGGRRGAAVSTFSARLSGMICAAMAARFRSSTGSDQPEP